MIPAGYIAKKIAKRPDWLKSDSVEDIFSVSGCISQDFSDDSNHGKQNKYWFFDSPDIIQEILLKEGKGSDQFTMLYYELYEKEFNQKTKKWESCRGEESFGYSVKIPMNKSCMGYDIVAYSVGTSHECSLLSCNHLAEEIPVNKHCLVDTLEGAIHIVERLDDFKAEPGPYRIIGVYRVESR